MPESSYSTRHWRVVQARGKAREYDCVRCGRQAQEWSQIHGKSGESPNHYRPMCCSCHQKYDNHWSAETRAKLSKTLKGRTVAPETGRKISEAKMGMKYNWSKKGKETITKKMIGNTYASGKRTPEQCERIRIGRWGR